MCVCVWGGGGGGGIPSLPEKKWSTCFTLTIVCVLKKKKENCFNLLYLAIDFRVHTYMIDMYKYMKERKEGRKEELRKLPIGKVGFEGGMKKKKKKKKKKKEC